MTTRRDLLRAAAAVPLAFTPLSSADAMRAAAHALAALEGAAAGAPYAPKFFRPTEWTNLRILVDLIIPRDQRSGSATEAGVPEFMDWTCSEYPSYAWTREALRWLGAFAYETYDKSFAKCTDAQRRRLLDQIAWPKKAKPELKEGVTHFNDLRDFTASGFWSSQMGVRDLQYLGNTAVPEWKGCPPNVLTKFGVTADVMDRRIRPAGD